MIEGVGQASLEQYHSILVKQFPSIAAVTTEIINLKAILKLPKGTEHFMSDLHGEYEAFNHIMNNCSGVIKDKIDRLFSDGYTEEERAQFASLIYYPEQKLLQLKDCHPLTPSWYSVTMNKLLMLCRDVASKYTRSKVRKAMPSDISYIMDELLHSNQDIHQKQDYYISIIDNIIDIGNADKFIIAISEVIKRLAVDHLHIIGDIYDRGDGAEEIFERLIKHHNVDIQWGNHDVLWMGAAAGSYACIANVLNICLQYGNIDTIENGYGISLRAATSFAEKTYKNADAFMPKVMQETIISDKTVVSKLRKAMAVIQFKCSEQIIARHPEYDMDDRLILNNIDFEKGCVSISGKNYPLKETDFPTIDPQNPSKLSEEEEEIICKLAKSFKRSTSLKKHIEFLYEKGSLYLAYNGNLLFHGCVPLNKDGSFTEFNFEGKKLGGKALFDYCDEMMRKAYYLPESSPNKQNAVDFAYYLWCGKHSPLLGKERMTSFERALIADKTSHTEEKNAYYHYLEDENMVDMILKEFNINNENAHIINGHMPVKLKDGESPAKANGRLLVIDGGFCKAYQPTTGIAGYTLIYNSMGMRIVAHEPFDSVSKSVKENLDIHSTSSMFQPTANRVEVSDTDIGTNIKNQIAVLENLLSYYRERERG